MKNDKRRKAEKLQDKLEPDKATMRNLGRIVDRLDETNDRIERNADLQQKLIVLIQDKSSLKVENLDEVKFPSSFRIENLNEIPVADLKLPEVFSARIAEKPDWYVEPQPIPEIVRAQIDWDKMPREDTKVMFETLKSATVSSFEALGRILSGGISIRQAEGERIKPQMVIVLDGKTGEPMKKEDFRPLINVEQRIPPTGTGGGSGGLTDVTDRATRLLGIVYGNLAQLQQKASTLELLTYDNILATVLGTASLLSAGRLKAEASQTGAWSVSVSNFPATYDISDRVARLLGSVSLGVSSGKTNIMKTGSLTTTATTADQVVLTYTVTAGKTFYLEYFEIEARLTALSATASILGTASLENPSGTKGHTSTFTNQTTSEVKRIVIPLAEPIPIATGTVIRVVCTPAAATSMLWIGNFGGYEK